MKKENNHEFEYSGVILNGFLMLCVIWLLLPAIAVLNIVLCGEEHLGVSMGVAVPIGIAIVIMSVGFFVQQPNEARVMIFFGKYRGSCRKVGFYWLNPLMEKKKLSLRIRNMDIDPIKVNDRVGNPVLIGMVLVWKIKDTYKVVFDLDSASLSPGSSSISSLALEAFVRIQSDAALREVTGQFAYDPESGADTGEITLRDGGEHINELLEHKINERLSMAGIEVVEARLNYLAYAPEIAAVMLKRQQASAVITAREKIVEGAVSMVEMALERLDRGNTVKLNEDQKAAMVANLMVVLCADEPVTPMMNTTA